MTFINSSGLAGCQDCPRKNGSPAGAESCCADHHRIFENRYYDPKQMRADSYALDDSGFAGLGPKNGIAQSERLWTHALEVIPGGTQTLSKGPGCFVDGVSPKYLARGSGSRVWDVDDNEYIDYCLGCFPLTLGYGFAVVDDAIKRQLDDGITFSMMHPLEIEVSDRLIELIPGAEMVRFAKNGSDVTSMAIRLARHITGRDRVACLGYHGFQDWYVATTDRNSGIPGAVKELTHPFRYNDIASLESLFQAHRDEFACVIMEPALFEFPRDGFLEKVKELAHANGALLIFDEMLTGFRFANGGGQELFGVVPDLGCFGKGVANGMPIGVLTGLERHMCEFETVFFSTTYGGEALTLAAAKAALDFYKSNDVVARLWRSGKILFDNLQRLIGEKGLEENVSIIGFPVRFQLAFRNRDREPDYLLNALYQQEMTKRGIICYANLGLSYSHTDDELIYTARSFGETLDVMARAIESGDVAAVMEGTPSVPVFRALRDQKQTAN